jgi:RNA polymerase sigma-70 factor (sigma-E family)
MGDQHREFVEFVESASPSLRRTAFMICGDWHRADDVVQDGLYKLYLSWARVSRLDDQFAYARRTVINAAVDHTRRGWRREITTADLTQNASSRDDYATGYAQRDELTAALNRLAPGQRACVVLRYYEDLSIEQTAEILGCTSGMVKSQTFAALRTLRHVINETRQIHLAT